MATQIFFIFTPTWGNDPIWLFFSNGLKPPTIVIYIYRPSKSIDLYTKVRILCYFFSTGMRTFKQNQHRVILYPAHLTFLWMTHRFWSFWTIVALLPGGWLAAEAVMWCWHMFMTDANQLVAESFKSFTHLRLYTICIITRQDVANPQNQLGKAWWNNTGRL